VTMEISDDDYAVLRRGVERLQHHAGNDAPGTRICKPWRGS